LEHFFNTWRTIVVMAFGLCITGENEQPFRSMANGNFGRSRTPISDEAEQSFRLMPNGRFGLKPNSPGS
jgi:hypothetical protein